ncbi:transposase [Sulfitobacter porphyrae]|uniref:Transposase n=1 Tax=Sulfitobacter porphyrae TaxID=1246864 RepID=A0ABW2BB48_9RHOB|nr:hypothetical protein GCM10007928_29760 [Sulfitobacter porphyrae]
MSLPYRGATGPLNLLIDSTGIKSEGEGEWKARKHGWRIWRKIHIGIGEETLEVRAVEVTTSNVGDARKCHDAIAARNAHAVIPPRKNAKPRKPTSAGAVTRNEAVRASRYLGRALWRNWSGDHRRSRVETKMNCIKLLGQSLMSRDFDRQIAEIKVRIAVLNRYIALGIPVTEAVG